MALIRNTICSHLDLIVAGCQECRAVRTVRGGFHIHCVRGHINTHIGTGNNGPCCPCYGSFDDTGIAEDDIGLGCLLLIREHTGYLRREHVVLRIGDIRTVGTSADPGTDGKSFKRDAEHVVVRRRACQV